VQTVDRQVSDTNPFLTHFDWGDVLVFVHTSTAEL
jgi:hypothetical protein